MTMPVRLKVCSRSSSSRRDRSPLRTASASRTFFFTQAVLFEDRLDLRERHALAFTLQESGQSDRIRARMLNELMEHIDDRVPVR